MPRILIVDDDPDIVETLRYALEREGFAVQSAVDGLEALAAARDAPPDLMLLDVMLPGANGYEVARFLKQDMREGRIAAFKIILLTARRVTSAARREFLQTWSGADATIWKPYDLNRIVAEIHRHLGAYPVAGGAS
jgi:CheY-like chemotaxis protein